METNYNFPDPYIDPKNKGKEYILKYGKCLYSNFRKSNVSLFYNNRNEYRRNIEYALGNQSIDQYKERIDAYEDRDKSSLNLDWQILNLCTKFVNVIVGKLNKNEHEARCRAIDILAVNQKKEYKAKMDSYLALKAWMDSIGVEASQYFADTPDMDLGSEDREIDLNLNLKHKWSIKMELILKKILIDSKFEQIKRELAWDSVVLGVRVMKITEREDGLPFIEKVNPENFVTSYTDFEDFRDIQNGGEVKLMSVAEFFKRAKGEFTEAQKQDMITQYAKSKPGLSSEDYGRYVDQGTDQGKYFEVLDFSFLSQNEQVFEKKKDKRGNTKMYRKNFGFPQNKDEYKAKYGEEREVIRSDYNGVYKGLWIVSSNYICDYGLMEDALYDEVTNDNVLPYVIYAPNLKYGEANSTVKQMIPILNNIQINWLRFNDCLAKYIPKGAYLDLDALEDISLGKGGKNLTPKQVINLWTKRGILVGRRSKTGHQGAHGLPIQELQNGMSADADRFFQYILQDLGLIRDIIGLNEVTDSSTPDPKMLKSVAEAAQVGTNNALENLFHADNMNFNELCTKLSYSVVGAERRGVDLDVDEAIGDGVTKFFGDNSKMTSHKYSIFIESKPSQDEWNEFYQDVRVALDKGMITLSDAAFVREIDNLKQARQYLAMKERRKTKEMAAQQQQAVEQNAQVQQQSTQMAGQLKQQEIQMEGQLQSGIEQAKGQFLLALEQEKRETLKLKYDLELRNAQAMAITNSHVQAEQIDQKDHNEVIKSHLINQNENKSEKK